jgi:hypothetical protein
LGKKHNLGAGTEDLRAKEVDLSKLKTVANT